MWKNNFTGNLDRDENPTIFFIIEESKETILDFLEKTRGNCSIILLYYNISIT